MKRTLITISGKDKPGIVAKVSELLFREGCNLEDISMTLLEGQFAMMMTVCFGREGGTSRVRKTLETLRKAPWQMDYTLNPLRGELRRGAKHPKGSTSFVITALGKDRTGIVYEVSRALARLKINITDLDSRILGTGKNALYAMLLEVDMPSAKLVSKTRKILESLGRKLKIEIHIKPLERLAI